MPKSKTRRKKPVQRRVPNLAKPIASNLLEAEADPEVFQIPFEWRGHVFTADLANIQYGRGLFNLRLVDNDSLSLTQRLNAMLDVYESAIGQAQLALALQLEPRLFEDAEALASFWTAFTEAVTGLTAGESQAS